MLSSIIKAVKKFEQLKVVLAIRKGLEMCIPVLMVGSVLLVLRSLPIPVYQRFITQFCGGALFDIFSAGYNATFGVLSIFITLAISTNYAQARLMDKRTVNIYGVAVTALAVFVVFSGYFTGEISSSSISCWGVKGMFNAIISSTLTVRVMTAILNRRWLSMRAFSDGADINFNNIISLILPSLFMLLSAALISELLTSIFSVNSLQQLIINGVNHLFTGMGRSLLSGLWFVFLSSVLWMFAIHGSDVLESVSEHLFVPGTQLNVLLTQQGKAPTEIVTRTFIDVFVLMGGCGVTICLLIAIILFSKRRGTRSLSKLAALPMIFNINELTVFGLPIVFNVRFLIPFICTPLVCTLTTYAAMATGLVPLTAHTVEWTTPVLLSGYIATGSIAGSLLQLVNIAIGVAIYRPFLKMYDKGKQREATESIHELVKYVSECEDRAVDVNFDRMKGAIADTAKQLTLDLRQALAKGQLQMYYQPQFDHLDRCVGAEALLRWNHPTFGFVYPPLIIDLAQENDFLPALEYYVIESVLRDTSRIDRECRLPQHISINISAPTLGDVDFEQRLRSLTEKYMADPSRIDFEITERTAIVSGGHIEQEMQLLHRLGYSMSIDDFSMGHTSLKYLQQYHFENVKLDGLLVKKLLDNRRTADIIDSIIYLSGSLHFNVVAEYVETKELRDALEKLGCRMYQGYLFSPAVPIDDYIKIANEGPQKKVDADTAENPTT